MNCPCDSTTSTYKLHSSHPKRAVIFQIWFSGLPWPKQPKNWYLQQVWVCKNFSRPFKLLPHDVEYKIFLFELGTLLAAAPQKGSPYLSMKLTDRKFPSLTIWGVFMWVNIQQNRVVPNFQFFVEIPYVWQKGRWPHPKRAVLLTAPTIKRLMTA